MLKLYYNYLIMKVYSIEIFKNIKQNNTTKLPLNILESINELSELVTAPEYSKTPEFFDKYKKNKKKNEKKNDFNNEDLLNFSRTTINKKEGIEKDIDIIRGWLNKITNSSYDTISMNIKNYIENIANTYSNDECKKIGDNFIDILLYNILYSKLYADLLKELYKYNFISNSIKDSIDNFLIIYKNNKEIIDEKKLTFDEVSIINKNLDKNKSRALLYVNLFINQVIEKSIIINFIDELLNLFFDLTSIKGKNIIVTEITEIIYILVKHSYIYIKDSSDWEEIENNIIYIANMKSNSRENINNKIIFKFMDLKDWIK